MKALAGGLIVSVACTAPLFGQERDRSLERISLSLQQPLPALRMDAPVDSPAPKAMGIFTLVPPTLRGEIVRASVPIGDLVSRAFNAAAAANRRRQEAAARRQVQAELARFTRQRPSPNQ